MGSKIDKHVLDLGRMTFVSYQNYDQNALVPSDVPNHGPLCVTQHLIASGLEPNAKTNTNANAALWDRHHGIRLALFEHSEPVNAIAINPIDESTVITVSDDMSLKLWRSKLRHKVD